MKYTAKEIIDIFKQYPEDEIIFMWFKAREEFEGVVDISEEEWIEVEDSRDRIYDYVNSTMFDLVCAQVDGDGEESEYD